MRTDFGIDFLSEKVISLILYLNFLEMSNSSRTSSFVYLQSIFWKLLLCISLFYEMFLISLLFQTKTDARDLRYISPALGRKLPERSYAENCSLKFEVIQSQLDGFFFSHIIGSGVKGLLFRDYWMCWILSIMFEILEYSLEHQLPNFAECWWDHWILDVSFCNAIGIYLGIKLMEYFQLEKYYWREIKHVDDQTRKDLNFRSRVTSVSSNRFDLLPKSGLRHYISVLLLIEIALQCELNVFYLKYLLWIPSEHYLVILRLLIFSLVCAPAVSEVYQNCMDPKHNKLGLHTLFVVINLWTETFVCFKLSKGEFPNPAPFQVKIFWTIFFTILIIYPIITFDLIKRFKGNRRKE